MAIGDGDGDGDGDNSTVNKSCVLSFIGKATWCKHDYFVAQPYNSVAIVSVSDNDYSAYLARNADDDLQKLPAFAKTIMQQLGENLERIQGLGVKRIAVILIEPMGCVPLQAASSSYTNCSEVLNLGSKFHNQMLKQALKNLNDKSNSTVFVTLDLYNVFISALNKLRKRASGSLGMKNPLKPCCEGKEKGKYYCGSMDESGAKQYGICENPNLSLFWDTVHPSQNGWHTIFSSLRSSLHTFIT
ncbi:GDSL esterase/lipase At5g03610-like [Hibiscus syriacus]|uniref:GDSL esterase/lipase At5g03610-like n=1 Tax=Hibiscus syriacus TaxID=106335 RepID=UPI0019246960|nr:GDSL esterase/lipase At5g03610-like [Hibiscus syriacus]